MDSKGWFIIVNPSSGGGVSKKKLSQIIQYLKLKNLWGDLNKTSPSINAESLAKKAIREGYRRVVCVGGDGTIHNLINGILNQTDVKPEEVVVGLIPVGTGNDWARHHNIPTNYKKAIDTIGKNNITQQDVGKMKVMGDTDKTIYFINYAGVGFDGYVISKIEKFKFLGALSYLIAAITNFISFKNIKLQLDINSNKKTVSAFMLGVGVCKYTGGGMKLAKNPKDNDGLLDVTLAEGFTKLDVIRSIPRLFNGNLFKNQKVSSYKTKKISVKIVNGGGFAQADGELIHGESFEFKILKNAISFFK